jgi:CBS domain containing-hemolysin-like protein
MTAAVLLVLAVLLVAFGGLMTAMDAALSVTGRQDMAELALQGRSRTAIETIAADPEAHANAIVFIRVLAETAAAVLVTAAFMILFGGVGWALVAAIVLMTAVSFVAVGVSPRSVGRRHARALLAAAAPIVRGVRILLGPLANALVSLSNRVTPGGARAASFDSEEQLLSMVDEAVLQDLIEPDDRELIHSVFEFTDTFVRAVMVPRTDLITLPADAPLSDALPMFLDTGVSRLPLLSADGEDVVGILYLKDLVQFAFRNPRRADDTPVVRIARAPVFVPESMRAESLLQQMKRDAVHVCMVVDEYGGIAGLVTMEDLIEELVGEIADEYDVAPAEVVEIDRDRFRVSSRVALDEVGDLFGLDLEDEDVESIGGLLGKLLGRVPQPGDEVEFAGLRIVGGTSRGRGRGLATVFVERAEAGPGVGGRG